MIAFQKALIPPRIPSLKSSNPNYVLPAPAPDTATRLLGSTALGSTIGSWFLEVLAL